MAVLSSKKKKSVAKKTPPKREKYEPSHFVWLRVSSGSGRVPALVLYGEDTKGDLVVYVTPTGKDDTGRREVYYNKIEGRIR